MLHRNSTINFETKIKISREHLVKLKEIAKKNNRFVSDQLHSILNEVLDVYSSLSTQVTKDS